MFLAFDEAFPKMSVGERAMLTCSPDVAYGPNGLPPRIPPNATVKFEAELLELKWSRRAEASEHKRQGTHTASPGSLILSPELD